MHHLLHHRGNEAGFTAPQVRRLARKLAPATIDDVALVMTADSLGRPPKDASDSAPLIAQLLEKARALAIEREAPRPLIQGRHLVELGRKPGPEFKAILGAAFEAQLDGVFTDENGGMTWLEGYLRDPDPWRNA
jgi:tRNA nucleotidyltransferase (CCA-adding enzyme)